MQKVQVKVEKPQPQEYREHLTRLRRQREQEALSTGSCPDRPAPFKAESKIKIQLKAEGTNVKLEIPTGKQSDPTPGKSDPDSPLRASASRTHPWDPASPRKSEKEKYRDSEQ